MIGGYGSMVGDFTLTPAFIGGYGRMVGDFTLTPAFMAGWSVILL